MFNFWNMLLSWFASISLTFEYSTLELLKIPDCSSGRKLLEMIRDKNCFCTLSSVLSALSTLDLIIGSRSGISIENDNLGLRSFSLIEIPHSTGLLFVTDVVSAIKEDSEARGYIEAFLFHNPF